MAKKKQVKPVRRKKDFQDKYSIRIQGGRTGLVEATSKMDIHEFRVFTTMLTMVLPEDEDFTEYEIRVQDIIKLFSLNKDGRYYDLIREASQSLLSRKFVIYEMKDGIEYKTTINLIDETSEPVMEEHQNHVRLKFSPKLKPYLLQLKREYLTIDIRNLVNIKSPYSVKMYLILKHQQRLGNSKAHYDVGRLRQILAIEDGEYVLYGSFKQQILRKAISDIEKYTDLSIPKMEEEKAGKSIVAVIFHLQEKEAPRQKELKVSKAQRNIVKKSDGSIIIDAQQGSESFEDATIVEVKEAHPVDEIYEKVKKYKIAKNTVNAWFKEYPMEQIQLGIDYVLNEVKEGRRTKNIGGFINTMVRNPSLFEVEQTYKKEVEQKRQQEQRQQQAHQLREQEINQLKTQAHTIKQSKLLELFVQDEVRTSIMNEIKNGLYKAYYKDNLSLEDNMKTNPMLGGFIISIATKLYPSEFEQAEQLIRQAEELQKGMIF